MKKLLVKEMEMVDLGRQLGSKLVGGEVVELQGDVGAGKTTLVKAIALGLGVDETVQSPSFTISRLYDGRDDLILAHYDFYRLADAGIMKQELAEKVAGDNFITIVEWGDNIQSVLPDDRLVVKIKLVDDETREVSIESHGPKSQALEERIL